MEQKYGKNKTVNGFFCFVKVIKARLIPTLEEPTTCLGHFYVDIARNFDLPSAWNPIVLCRLARFSPLESVRPFPNRPSISLKFLKTTNWRTPDLAGHGNSMDGRHS